MQPLPRFDNPPVVETVLGVYFRPLKGFTSAHQGLLWERSFRKDFPAIEERPPIDEVHEHFGEGLKFPGMVRWEVSDHPPPSRFWAASTDGEHILQLQRNAILANWQKPPTASGYRSYRERVAEFRFALEKVDEFVEQEKLGRVVPTSCLVTYVNHLDCSDPTNLSSLVERTLELWQGNTPHSWLPAPDKLNLSFGFPMPEERGRLNVSMMPAVRRSDDRYVLRMDLSARGTPAKPSVSSAVEWLDLGHEWVVRGFASITRGEMHTLWGRTQ